MTKRIVDVPQDLERKIWAKLKAGDYADFDHLVAVAVENQLLADQGERVAWGPPPGSKAGRLLVVKDLVVERGLRHSGRRVKEPTSVPAIALTPASTTGWKAPESVKIAPEPDNDLLVAGPLWGQFYRILPTKPALRILGQMSADAQPTFASFRSAATAEAEAMGLLLLERDVSSGRKFGDRASTSFPSPDEKSRRRYRDQFLGYVRPGDGRLDGLLPRLKLVNIWSVEGTHIIGITAAGLEFARLPNPVIDGGASKSIVAAFSAEESRFLLDHIRAKLPTEDEHMRFLLRAIQDGVTEREALNARMRDFYGSKLDNSAHWSDAHVNTMRAGVTSRLYELGLLERERSPEGVKYTMTEAGRAFAIGKPLEAR